MTRIAVISDIHGNCVALDTVLADLRRGAVDQIVCLGDAIQGGAQPAATVQRLRELACPVVMGNADAWLLTGVKTGEKPETEAQERVRQWSLARLSPDDQAFIATFAPTVTIPLSPERELLCFHGSPTSFDQILLPSLPSEEFRRALDQYAPAVLTGGHTHVQQVRQLTATFFFNPGSVGVACNYELPRESRRREPWAEYAILSETDGVISLEFRRAPLPMATLRQELITSGHPDVDGLLEEYGLPARL
jgi:predicted phosphodiesterase